MARREQAIGVAVAAVERDAGRVAHPPPRRLRPPRKHVGGGGVQVGVSDRWARPDGRGGAVERGRPPGRADPALARDGLVDQAQHGLTPVQQGDEGAPQRLAWGVGVCGRGWGGGRARRRAPPLPNPAQPAPCLLSGPSHPPVMKLLVPSMGSTTHRYSPGPSPAGGGVRPPSSPNTACVGWAAARAARTAASASLSARVTGLASALASTVRGDLEGLDRGSGGGGWGGGGSWGLSAGRAGAPPPYPTPNLKPRSPKVFQRHRRRLIR